MGETIYHSNVYGKRFVTNDWMGRVVRSFAGVKGDLVIWIVSHPKIALLNLEAMNCLIIMTFTS